MKKVLPTLIAYVLLCSSLIPNALAATTKPTSAPVQVAATVGEFTLDISGYIAPFASVVLRDRNGVFMRSTVADKEGNFFFVKVSIRRGFDGFCLTAVDFKQIGSSEACFSVPAATDSVEMKELFLPPTLGLARAQIALGKDAVAMGYTMPGAIVTLRINRDKSLTTTADSTGYYTFTISDLPVGEYELKAQANYKGKDSVAPSKGVKVIVLSLGDQARNWLQELLDKLWKLLTSIGLGPLWLLFPLLLLILLLLKKLYPERFTFITKSKLWKILFGRKSKKHLHHSWFLGY